MARKAKKRRYSRSAGDDVEREMRRYKKGTAKSGPGGRGGGLSENDNVTLRRDGIRYRSLYDFTAPAAGTTRVRCHPAIRARGPLDLAIGPRFEVGDVLGIVLRVIGSLAALFLGFGLGVGVGVLVGVLRDRSKRNLQAEAAEKPPPT